MSEKLTPSIAQDLIWRQMALQDITTSDFDAYGGYDAVKSMYENSGNEYSLEAIPAAKLKEFAQKIANQGTGNLGVLKITDTPLSAAGAQNLVAVGGADLDFFDLLEGGGIPIASDARDAAQQTIRAGGKTDAELRKIFTDVAKSGGYNAKALDSWVNAAKTKGLSQALIEYVKVNPGSGNKVTSISGPLGEIGAQTTLAQIPIEKPSFFPSSVIPRFNAADVYPKNLPYYPAPQQSMGLRAAMETTPLINQPAMRPSLTPQTAYVGQPATGLNALNPQVSYIPNAPSNPQSGGLAGAAQNIAAQGRGGDSVLVHMTPGEVAGLQSLAQQMGGSLTVNPETGLPEANFFKKILPIVAAVAAPYLAPGLAGAAIAGGLAATGTVLGGGNLSEGIKTGLTAFGAAGLSSGAMGSDPLGATTGSSTFNVANTFGGAKGAGNVAPELGGVRVTADPNFIDAAYGPFPEATTAATLQPGGAADVVAKGAASGAGAKAAGTKILGMDPSTLLLGGTLLAGGTQAAEEQKLYEQQQREQAEEIRRRRQLGYAAYERSGLASIPMGAGGGLVAMAGGGMTYMEAGGTTGPTGVPRDVTGTGDGMSDSVPATIEGVQEARLADGEFVIPADVVADIGNGSSDAGSKKLYDMMDRIRKARHGTTEQPPEIDAEALMPA